MRAHRARGPRGALILVASITVLLVAASGASPAAPPGLAISPGAQTLVAGAPSQPITVTLVGGAQGPASVSLSSSSARGTFLVGGTPVSSVTIPSGATSASFVYTDTLAGTPTVSAVASANNRQFNGRPNASQRETIQAGPLARLSVSPAQASVAAGAGQVYSATGQDQYGNSLGLVTGATTFTISPDGSCVQSTCSASVAGTHTVTGTDGSARGTATLTVTAVDHIAMSPTAASVPIGSSQSYTVQAQSKSNANLGDVSAASTFSIAPDGSCTSNQCGGALPGLHTVTASYGSLTASSSLAVTSDCQTSAPSSGAYTITVCLTPTSGSTVSGNQPVTATVTVNGTDPHTAKVIFYLDGQYLITDYQTPYTFQLPSARWVDGAHTLEAEANERDGFVAQHAVVSLTFSNGVTSPPSTAGGFQPTSGTAPATGQPFVLAAVGDGAGGENGETAVTNMIEGWQPNLFLYLGDVYEKGTPTEFMNWYGTAGGAFFGQFRAITNPTVGNHEYTAGQAPGYFDYWNTPPDYYSVNTPVGWHLVSLNSNLAGTVGSAQYNWLASDLANNVQPCTLVFFHHPLFNIGAEPVPTRFTAIWPLLARYGVDIVLNGHDHDYQRWVPLNGNGNPDPAGPTEFVVGTGGHSLQSFVTSDTRVANSLAGSFGALRLDLNPGGASYQYATTSGGTVDSGGISCNPSGVDTMPPTTPTNLQATTTAQTSISAGVVNLSWNASSDNVGVTSYKIFRDGTLVGTVGAQTSFADQTVSPSTSYGYQVQALDAAGNASNSSDTLTVTTPQAAPIFSDGFESGDLSNWSTVAGLGAQQTDVSSGSWAAEGVGDGTSVAYGWRTLPASLSSVYYRIRFKLVSQGSNTVYLERFRTTFGAPSGSAASILGVFVSATGKLGIRDDVGTGSTTTGRTTVSVGVWHTLQVHVTIADTSSQVETWLDGVQIPELTITQTLGTDPVGIIQLGENSSGKTYDVRFDDVAVDSTPLP